VCSGCSAWCPATPERRKLAEICCSTHWICWYFCAIGEASSYCLLVVVLIIRSFVAFDSGSFTCFQLGHKFVLLKLLSGSLSVLALLHHLTHSYFSPREYGRVSPSSMSHDSSLLLGSGYSSVSNNRLPLKKVLVVSILNYGKWQSVFLLQF
jgi:hypothetical protein